MQLNTFQQPFRGLQINRTHPLAKNLIGYWVCNDGTGKKVWDYSGNGNQGTLEGTAPAWTAGGKGWAVNLPGTNERIDCGNGAPLDDLGSGSFYISFRMKSKDVTPLNYGLMFNKLVDDNNKIFLSSSGTVARLNLSIRKAGAGINNVPFSAASNPYDTNWNHIVLEINRTSDKAVVYMNTIKDATEIDLSALAADMSNAANVQWGAWDGNFPFEGALDELRIYTGVPTQEIINWLYWEPYALFKSWRRRYQFFPDRMFLTFAGKTLGLTLSETEPGITMAGNTPGVTITGDKG